MGEVMKFRAKVKKSDDWWIGWLIDLPGVNAQEKTREELPESLRIGAEDLLSTAVPFEAEAQKIPPVPGAHSRENPEADTANRPINGVKSTALIIFSAAWMLWDLIIPQAIPHPRFGQEILGAGGVFFQLAPEIENEYAQIGILVNIRRSPHFL